MNSAFMNNLADRKNFVIMMQVQPEMDMTYD